MTKWQRFKKWMSSDKYDNLKFINFIIKAVWYGGLLSVITYYVYTNWESMTTTNLFSTLNGDALIFFLWIVLLIIPFIKGVEAFGLKVEFNKDNLASVAENSADEILEDVHSISSNDIHESYSQLQEERGEQ